MTLKVVRAHLTSVDIPLTSPYVSSLARVGKRTTTRTIVRLETEQGIVGIGETTGTPDVFRLVSRMAHALLDMDPLDVRGLRRALLPNVYGNLNGRNGAIAFAGIETACWDLAGKAYGVPVWQLLGGRHREHVPVAGLMSAFPLDADTAEADLGAIMKDEANVERVVDHARALVGRHGFRSLKIKSAGVDRVWDVQVVTALRDAFGPRMNLRLDPNGAFAFVDALRLGQALQGVDLEYLEDPTRGLDAMARLRKDVATPLATNMCIIDFEQLAAGIRMGAADVVLGDVYHWGGVQGFVELAAVCKTFDIGLGIHSFVEAGVATAVNAHLAAVLPELAHAMDHMLHFQDRSILTNPISIEDGLIEVPSGPGWGVDLDEHQIRQWAVDDVRIPRAA